MNTEPINLQFTNIKEPLPDFIYEGLKLYSSGANAYKPQPTELIERLAVKHNIPKEMIFLTAGVDEAIQIFAKAYGQNAFVFTPTYVVYRDVEELGGKLTRIYSIKDNEFNINGEAIPNATLIFLANPNNPSGITTKEKVMSLVTNNPQAKVVIDEAYGEFADLSVIDQVQKYPQMVIFRSFSKAYGMAGNRVGYVITDPEIIKVVRNKTQWANVSYLSVGAAMTALNHEDYFQKIREDIGKRREEYIVFLKDCGFTMIPSRINAILFKFPSETEGIKFADYLANNNFIISHGDGHSNIGLDKSFIRIAIGTAPQMQTLKEVILNFVNRVPR
jgi:histidinol-phosphate aminotransferase